MSPHRRRLFSKARKGRALVVDLQLGTGGAFSVGRSTRGDRDVELRQIRRFEAGADAPLRQKWTIVARLIEGVGY
eukprot:12410348-Prorocentrum_lima.AAC.1